MDPKTLTEQIPIMSKHVHTSACTYPCMEGIQNVANTTLTKLIEAMNPPPQTHRCTASCRCALHTTPSCTYEPLYDEMTPEEQKEMRELIAFTDSLQALLPPRFVSIANKGSAAYIAGQWDAARVLIDKALEMVPVDKPLKMLKQYIKKHDYQAPPEWPGYRALLKK